MAKQQRHGTCRLCLLEQQDLQDSHYMPKGIYRLLRTEGADNPNPVAITPRGAAQTSRQARAHLLCRSCEGLLDRNGENWVLHHLERGQGEFRLGQLIEAVQPFANDEGHIKFYIGDEIPGLNAAAIAYFAGSIFWRGSIHPWNTDGRIPVPLGPYGEAFRLWLLGAAPFPEAAALHVYVRDAQDLSRLMVAPWGGRSRSGGCGYMFTIPGLQFWLHVGKQVPQVYRDYCFVNAPGHPLVVTDKHEPFLQALTVDAHQKAKRR